MLYYNAALYSLNGVLVLFGGKKTYGHYQEDVYLYLPQERTWYCQDDTDFVVNGTSPLGANRPLGMTLSNKILYFTTAAVYTLS